MQVIARKIFFAATAFFCLIGHLACQAPPVAGGPTEMSVYIPDRDAFYDRTLTFLRERDFAPEYVNRDEGLILSQPSTGQQWFECWRHDSIGGYQLLESSIHTVRRIVTVKIEPLNASAAPDLAEVPTTNAAEQTIEPSVEASALDPENYRLSVEVSKERYSAPERQVTTASGALAIYSDKLPTTAGYRTALSESERWVPLGRDVLLEEYLLRRLMLLTPPPPYAEPAADAEPAAAPDSTKTEPVPTTQPAEQP